MIPDTILSIFIFGILLNFIWEFLHCRLYKTCEDMPKQERSMLLIGISIKDGFFITIFYLISLGVFGHKNLFEDTWAIILFLGLSLVFSFVTEKISLKKERWEYNSKMPKVFGVGLTPLLEIAITGSLAIYITFSIF